MSAASRNGENRLIRTSDGFGLRDGDRAFNYYDMKWGVIHNISDRAEPDVMRGQNSSTPMAEWSDHWFDFDQDDGSHTTLNGERICSADYAQRKGW